MVALNVEEEVYCFRRDGLGEATFPPPLCRPQRIAQAARHTGDRCPHGSCACAASHHRNHVVRCTGQHAQDLYSCRLLGYQKDSQADQARSRWTCVSDEECRGGSE